MLRTALLAICCVSAISASEAQQVSPPGALPAGQRLRNNAVAQPEDFSSPEARAKQVWRQNMAKKSARQPGCFTATFPSTEWKETTCSTAPARPHPIRLGPGPHAGGKGKSPVAQLNSSQIFAATGMLATVSGVTSETDTKAGANTWSLQLNTNAFDPGTLCAGQAGCIGWEQFVADTPGMSISSTGWSTTTVRARRGRRVFLTTGPIPKATPMKGPRRAVTSMAARPP